MALPPVVVSYEVTKKEFACGEDRKKKTAALTANLQGYVIARLNTNEGTLLTKFVLAFLGFFSFERNGSAQHLEKAAKNAAQHPADDAAVANFYRALSARVQKITTVGKTAGLVLDMKDPLLERDLVKSSIELVKGVTVIDALQLALLNKIADLQVVKFLNDVDSTVTLANTSSIVAQNKIIQDKAAGLSQFVGGDNSLVQEYERAMASGLLINSLS